MDVLNEFANSLHNGEKTSYEEDVAEIKRQFKQLISDEFAILVGEIADAYRCISKDRVRQFQKHRVVRLFCAVAPDGSVNRTAQRMAIEPSLSGQLRGTNYKHAFWYSIHSQVYREFVKELDEWKGYADLPFYVHFRGVCYCSGDLHPYSRTWLEATSFAIDAIVDFDRQGKDRFDEIQFAKWQKQHVRRVNRGWWIFSWTAEEYPPQTLAQWKEMSMEKKD
jgi:hypothetical protein